MVTTTKNIAPAGPTALSTSRVRALRAAYLANIIGAGVPGALMTFTPTWAMQTMFGGDQDRIVFGMTGAIWLAIGLLSLAGLRHPLPLAGILVTQIVYKTIWIATVAAPMLIAGDRTADVVPYTIFFALVVVLWLTIVPFKALRTRTTETG